jgi:hypothetical protein
MANNPVDYDLVIADLEGRRKAFNDSIDAAISGLRTTLAMLGAASGGATASPLTPSASASGFLGMTLLDAAKKALTIARRPLTNAEIADALNAGGFLHTSSNFTNTVGTSLWRAEENGDREIVRNGRTWLLREWAPGLRRSRSDDQNEGAANDAENAS